MSQQELPTPFSKRYRVTHDCLKRGAKDKQCMIMMQDCLDERYIMGTCGTCDNNLVMKKEEHHEKTAV